MALWPLIQRMSWALSVALYSACGAGVSEDPISRAVGNGQSGSAGNTNAQNNGGTDNSDEPLDATGSAVGAECEVSGDCASRVCIPDVQSQLRCCEENCFEGGRLCSAEGLCLCPAGRRAVAGRCLLVEGEQCIADADCALQHCVDGVCCSEPCDGICERCSVQGGECVLDENDRLCTDRTGFECTDRNRCRLPLAETCGTDADCQSEHCELGLAGNICCSSECSSTCQRCGTGGLCDAYPVVDEDSCPILECPADEFCRRYERPAPGACAANGQCLQCVLQSPRLGVGCEPGARCDSSGECTFDGVGLVAAGGNHTCAIRENGNVRCWGDNALGQLGAAFEQLIVGDLEAPSAVQELDLEFEAPAVQLTAGEGHTCALLFGGDVHCWGGVDSTLYDVSVPALLGTDEIALAPSSGFVDPARTGRVKLPAPAIQISSSARGTHTCALLETKQVACWGGNAFGQCGDGTTNHVSVAGEAATLPVVRLPGAALAIEVRVAAAHSCAVLEGGGLTCWGEGDDGRLGYGDGADRLEPENLVDVGGPVRAVATALAHTCAILEGGRVRCWGSGSEGKLGYGHEEHIGDDETPARAAELWYAPLNRPFGGDVPIVSETGAGGGALQITTAGDSQAMCARFIGGRVRCWGSNRQADLGYGHMQTDSSEFTPYQLEFRPTVNGRAMGGDLDFERPVLALADNGRCALMEARPPATQPTLFCWGDNEHGQLGLPNDYRSGGDAKTPRDLGPVSWEPNSAATP